MRLVTGLCKRTHIHSAHISLLQYFTLRRTIRCYKQIESQGRMVNTPTS
jgi:hypothetical protein